MGLFVQLTIVNQQPLLNLTETTVRLYILIKRKFGVLAAVEIHKDIAEDIIKPL